ncbi:uncharacterized protein VTP21DRAFT_957 [Calcarisporiella thermophila]|uniref:uncharacterized protein n=1 Tax=Calcarisporiella thermophila TaxID=911321 RepID=UPI0037431A9A
MKGSLWLLLLHLLCLIALVTAHERRQVDRDPKQTSDTDKPTKDPDQNPPPAQQKPTITITLTRSVTSTIDPNTAAPPPPPPVRSTITSTVIVTPSTSTTVVVVSSPSRAVPSVDSPPIATVTSPSWTDPEESNQKNTIIIAVSSVGGVLVLGAGIFILTRAVRQRKRRGGWDDEETTTVSVNPSKVVPDPFRNTLDIYHRSY